MKFETVIKTDGAKDPNGQNRKIYCAKIDPRVRMRMSGKLHKWCMDTFGVLGHWYEDIHGLNFYREEDFVLFVLRWS